jgi:hypothetical protein
MRNSGDSVFILDLDAIKMGSQFEMPKNIGFLLQTFILFLLLNPQRVNS